ncbi:MAG: hypothetical protein JW806_06450 [Sedimentisphaerales bacterium]|nr:hypothetical protein [Sedimentisphaerales bacterium]
MGKKPIAAKHIISSFLSLFWLLSCGYAAEQSNKSQTYGDITVSIISSFQKNRVHGYAEYKISVQNTSIDQTHIVTLSAPKFNYGWGGIQKITKTIVMPPVFQTTVSIFQPPLIVSGRNLEVIIDNKKQRQPVEMTFADIQTFYRRCSMFACEQKDFPPHVLLSQNVSYDDFKNYLLNPNLNETSSTFPTDDENWLHYFVISDSKIEAWSEQWFTYTPYDGIILTADEMYAAPENIKSALLKYLRCGGSLLILGKWNGIKKWQNEAQKADSLELYYIDFGICIINEANDVPKWSEQTWKKLNKIAWQPTGEELTRCQDIAAANDEFQIVPTLAIPVRGLFILVLVFAIIIGPVNLIILRKIKKRVWMLWTVPAVSILTSAAVFAYAICTEGLDSNYRNRTITILNQVFNNATTIGINAFYCPLTPRQGLHYDYETELTPIGIDTWRRGSSRVLDWTNDQHLETGWIMGRVPAYFLLRKGRVTAENINIIPNSTNELLAENHFDDDISKLWYADKNGKIYSAQNISAGTKIKLTLTEKLLSESYQNDTWRNIYSRNWANSYDRIIAKPEKYLRPGTYIAVLEASPFIEQPLKKAKIQKKSESLIIGIVESPLDGS